MGSDMNRKLEKLGICACHAAGVKVECVPVQMCFRYCGLDQTKSKEEIEKLLNKNQ